MKDNYLLLLQINDSQFPIGSYTQSYGLETYVQKNLVHNSATVEEFIRAYMEYSLLYSELLPVKLAFTAGKENNLDKLVELEQISIASRSPRELRDASLKLGKRFMRTVEGLSLGFPLDFFHEYQKTCEKIGISHAIAYGCFCSCGDFQKDFVFSTYFYSQVSALVTNCVKLVPLSQTEGQKILSRMQSHFQGILEKLEDLQENSLFLSCPALDLRSMEHEQLYSRLYMS